jgi:ferritin
MNDIVKKEELKSRIMNIARENVTLPEEDQLLPVNPEELGNMTLGGEKPVEDEGGLYKLSQETITELTDRIKDEYTAHYFYRNAANWCRDANYKKAAAFFETEANNELEHAKGLQDYMADFNIIAVIPSAETTKSFTNLPEIVRGAYKLELDLMMKYNVTSSKLFTSDLTTFDFLSDYRVGQKESVVEYNDLINALDLINESNKFEVLYFEQTYM